MSKDIEKNRKCGNRLKSAMAECGVKQKEMAADLNYSVTYFSELWNGKKPITEKLAKEFADYLNKKHAQQKEVTKVGFLSADEQQKYLNSGHSVSDWVEIESTAIEEYYSPQYFTGALDHPNEYIDSVLALDKENKVSAEFLNHFAPIFREILSYSGYDLVAPKFISITPNDLQEITTSNNLLRNRKNESGVPQYMTLRQKRTGKEITLSEFESKVFFSTIYRSMGTILDGLFLSRDADDDSSSENAPDLGKT